MNTELESLVNQMLCEHGEIQDLREKLRAAEKRYELLGEQMQQSRAELCRDLTGTAAQQDPQITLDDEDLGYDPQDWFCCCAETNALVEFQRNRERNLEQFDQRVSEGLQELRRGNPQFDQEWFI